LLALILSDCAAPAPQSSPGATPTSESEAELRHCRHHECVAFDAGVIDLAATRSDLGGGSGDLATALPDLSRVPPDLASPRDLASPPHDLASPPRDLASPPRDLASPPRDLAATPRDLASAPSGCGSTATVDHSVAGVQLFPSTNPWNTPIDTAPVDPASSAIIGSSTAAVLVETAIPVNATCAITPAASFTFNYAVGSDPGPYPITTLVDPMTSSVALGLFQESGPCGSAGCADGKDHHVVLYDRSNSKLYEIYQSYRDASGLWRGASGAVFDTTSNTPRPDGSLSADAAGLPILPGLVRCDEVKAGEIRHALRFTLSQTKAAFVHPATHFTHTAGTAPMGARFRLKASFDISPFSPNAQVILRALKKYGMFVADNGTPYGISGEESQSCWVDLGLSQYQWGSGYYFISSTTGGPGVHGTDFEVIQLGPQLTTEL
jgi:hypothetical protein